jgi:5-(carboxyamino)imidazole ribonucleotide synthase
MTILAPGGTIGILGGGQLGRMTAMAARSIGYRMTVLEPHTHSPAGQVADLQILAPYDDPAALARLADETDVVTLEFENIPVSALEWLAARIPTRPHAEILRICQDRLSERAFLRHLGIPVAPYAPIEHPGDLEAACVAIPLPALLKTARLGYDSKGQRRVRTVVEGLDAHAELGGVPCILEQQIDFAREISVIVARDLSGEAVTYPPAENVHVGGILDTSMAPARIPPSLETAARDLALRIAAALDLVGLLAVELFVTLDHRLLVNELAPRPHNSGHWSIEACRTSQFVQQVRTSIGAPVGPTGLLAPVATANLLGDLWQSGPPRWDRLLALPDVHLHLYGKDEARPGRKMGHLTAFGTSSEEARERVLAARALLTAPAAYKRRSDMGYTFRP